MSYNCYPFSFLSDSIDSQLGNLKNALSYAAVEVKTVIQVGLPCNDSCSLFSDTELGCCLFSAVLSNKQMCVGQY